MVHALGRYAESYLASDAKSVRFTSEDPDVVAHCIVGIINCRQPSLHHYPGRMAKVLRWLSMSPSFMHNHVSRMLKSAAVPKQDVLNAMQAGTY